VFFSNLNTLLSKLNFHKFTSLIAKDLDSILELIQLANHQILIKANLRATLYLFDNVYDSSNELVKKQVFDRINAAVDTTGDHVNIYDLIMEQYRELANTQNFIEQSGDLIARTDNEAGKKGAVAA
jgi:hypothetical protein